MFPNYEHNIIILLPLFLIMSSGIISGVFSSKLLTYNHVYFLDEMDLKKEYYW